MEFIIWICCFTTLSLSFIDGIQANQNEPVQGIDEIAINTFADVSSDAPQNVTLEPASSTSVIVRWEPPAREALSSVITGYKIKYKVKGSRKQETVTTDGNRRMYELTNLDKAATYMVKLAAVYPNGTGAWTEWTSSETYANDLDEGQVPDKPGSLSARPNSNTITVTWKPPKNQNIMIRGYTIGWGIGFPDVYTKVLDDKQRRSFVIDNLQPSSEYVISLRAFNQVGDGQPIYETVKTLIESTPEPLTPMIPPVGLKAQVISSTSVILYWTDTSLTRSQQVTDNRRYVVRYTSSVQFSANTPKYRYYNTTDLNCVIDDLKPNTQYEFAVKVMKGRRESTWSMSVFNTTQESAPSSPPRDLTVVPADDDDPTFINLHWQPPKQPNGQITGYVIFYTTDKTRRDTDWVVEGVIGDKMTTVLKGLLPESTYYFKIQARNKKGYGPLSAEVSFKTLPGGSPSKNEGRYATNTAFLIIMAISGIIILLLIVVGLLLCRSRNNSSGYMNGMRKSKGYIPAATSPGKSIGKGKGARELKPPDLWIHHDQMELKSMEKGMNGDAMTVTPIQRNSQEISDEPIEKSKKTTSTYGNTLYDDISKEKRDSSSPTDASITITSGSSTARRTAPTNTISLEPSTALSRPLYPRTQFNVPRAHVTLDASDSNTNMTGSHHLHHFYDPVAAPQLHGVSSCISSGQMAANSAYSAGGPQIMPANGPILNNTLGKRPPAAPLKSFSVPAPNTQPSAATPPHITIRPQLSGSPHKKLTTGSSFSQNPNVPNKSTHTTSPFSRPDLLRREDPSSCSTEELNQEMANLEGLMKDLSAITASEFEC